MPPPHNDDRNDRTCPACGRPFHRTGRRRYCSDGCRQAAWRRRTAASMPSAAVTLPRRSSRHATIYQCGDCDTRYLGEQWCPDCNRPCRRLAPGGQCDCGQLITIDELLNTT